MINIDSPGLDRVGFFKLDVEGMEVGVLRRARNTLHTLKLRRAVGIIKSDDGAVVWEGFDEATIRSSAIRVPSARSDVASEGGSWRGRPRNLDLS